MFVFVNQFDYWYLRQAKLDKWRMWFMVDKFTIIVRFIDWILRGLDELVATLCKGYKQLFFYIAWVFYTFVLYLKK